MKDKSIFQFKITLNDSKPKIWRRIQVPSDYSFFDLHVAIQDAMGWTDSHLHGFRITKSKTAVPIIIQYPDPEDDFGFGREVLDERKVVISDYFGKTIKQCVYEYDFGDGWDHTILFEKQLLVESGETLPVCIAGENACPPEDCGGVWGYMNLLQVLKNPKHPDHKDILEWLDIGKATEFDPMHFDPKTVDFRDPAEVLKEYKKGFGR